jgi:hypothetical protein
MFLRKGNENHDLGTGFLCIRESYQQLRGLSLLETGRHNIKRSLVSCHCSTKDDQNYYIGGNKLNCSGYRNKVK